MPISEDIDTAFAKFTARKSALAQATSSDLNESDTRFKIIDRLLVEVMGWDYSQISTEPLSSAGYLDYLLSAAARRGAIVIEAKALGLLIPNTASKSRAVLQLTGPVLKPLKAAIDQALSYAAAKGVPFAVATDGTCWLFFKASRTDGTAPLDGKGILFPDLDAIEANFAEFYELLSLSALNSRINLIHLNRAEGGALAISEHQYVVLPPLKPSFSPSHL